MNTRQLGTFNTMMQQSVQIGGDFPVWSRVDKVYQGGGYLDLSKFKPGDVIHAGTMVKFNGAGKQVEVITANGVGGIKEVDKFTFTSGATAAGNVGIVLGGTTVDIAVTADDDTPEGVAAKVAAGSFSGWTAKLDGATVTFTKSAAGVVVAPMVNPNSTGVNATVEVVEEGAAASGSLTDVNGLIWNDVCIPEGVTLATCAVVYAGRIYADRVFGGGIPASVEKQLPMIEFVHETPVDDGKIENPLG